MAGNALRNISYNLPQRIKASFAWIIPSYEASYTEIELNVTSLTIVLFSTQ